MKWNTITDLELLKQIDQDSQNRLVFIFKHSTRCSISSSALNRVERKWKEGDEQKAKPYFLDLIKHRNISDEIAQRYKIEHQSPQLLMIKNGECVQSFSHYDITYDDIFS